MKTQRAQDLLFLFGLTAMATAGCDADDGDSDSAATATASSTGANGSTGAGTDGTADSSGSTAADPTAPPSTSAGQAELCPAIAAKSVECESDTDYDTALGYCADTFAYLDMEYDADCVSAYEDVLACALTLDCKRFNDIPGTGCPAEQQVFEEACDFQGGGSTSSTSDGGTTTAGSTSG